MYYYQNPVTKAVYAYDPATQQKLIDAAVAAGWVNITGSWPPPPSDADLIAQCKDRAVQILYETDWATIPDVANPENSPYLTNVQAFISYRNAVRKYAVNPVKNPVWPEQPKAVWGM